jgi:spermidine synthase
MLVERRSERRARALPPGVVSALALAFLASGSAGLVHEVVWTRLLGLVFGVTELAVSTVLAAFMGGLALGSAAAGRYGARLADRRRTYAWLEIGIGACALAVPLLLEVVEPFYGWLWRRFHPSFALFSVLRLLVALVILLPPTVMMGATLPILAEHLARIEGRRLAPAWLYTLNLVGAVLGVVLAGFVLMPTVGVWGTVIAGSLVNVGVGLRVLTLPAIPEVAAVAPRAGVAGRAVAIDPLLLGAAFLSGLLSFAGQVAWTRVLVLVVGSTTYAFSTVLLVYLLALGSGSAWAARRSASPGRTLAVDLAAVHLLAALGTVVAVVAVNRLPHWYLALYDLWGPGALGGTVARGVAIAVVLLFPPVACAGTILPRVLGGITSASGGAGTAEIVGRLYAVNTVGAIAGAVLAGFVLVPRLGTQTTLLGTAAVSVAMGLAFAAQRPRRRWLTALAPAAAALVALGILRPPRWRHLELHAGVAEPGRLAGASRLADPRERLLYQRDGQTASVIVDELPDGIRVLVINARTNASDSAADMGTQVLVAQLPLLLAPRADRVLVIGWGSGVSVGSVTRSPSREIVAVELEPAVVEASHFFDHVNDTPLDDPRVRLLEDDARHVLLAAPETWDVIVSEPSHPWVSGVANLFTRDFYALAARRLAADGVMSVWVQTYQMSLDTYRSLLATFQSVFPEVLVFRPPSGIDTVLIGSRRPLRLDLAELEARLQRPGTREDLARIGVTRPEDVLALLHLAPAGVRALAGDARLNTDNNMYVEFRGPRDMERDVYGSSAGIFEAFARHAVPPETLLSDPAAVLGSRERLAALAAAFRVAQRDASRYEALARGRSP